MSNDFQQLVSDPERLRDLLDNCSFGGAFERWTKRKEFIADAIHEDGTFLDIGSGNGFLIRCLQEWSDFRLTPYGIDTNEQFIRKAKDLFPEYADNFVVLDARNLEQLKQQHLPEKYNFVFFSNKWTEETAKNANPMIEGLLGYVKPGGRLIIGFYDEDLQVNQQMFNLMKSAGIKWSGSQKNPHSTNLVGWIEKA